MKKIVIAVIAASTAFSIKSLLPSHAETVVTYPIAPVEVVAPREAVHTSPIATVAIPEVTREMNTPENVTPIMLEPLSFTSLSKLNEGIDENQNSFQPYYIQSFILPGTGTYFTATNISADALTSGNATIGSLNVEDGAEISGTLNTEKIIAGTVSAQSGVTLFDQATGEPYCLHVESGATVLVPNECITN